MTFRNEPTPCANRYWYYLRWRKTSCSMLWHWFETWGLLSIVRMSRIIIQYSHGRRLDDCSSGLRNAQYGSKLPGQHQRSIARLIFFLRLVFCVLESKLQLFPTNDGNSRLSRMLNLAGESDLRGRKFALVWRTRNYAQRSIRWERSMARRQKHKRKATCHNTCMLMCARRVHALQWTIVHRYDYLLRTWTKKWHISTRLGTR